MRIGIFSKTFPAGDVDASFRLVRENGYQATQFNFASAGLPSLPKEIPPAAIKAVAAARDRHGIGIEAISATFNLIHPDAAVIRGGLECLDAAAAAAAPLGCGLLTLCTGTLSPDDQWRRHPGNDSPAAWRAMLAGMEKALVIADRHNVLLGVEPELGNVVNSPEKARRLIDALGGERIRIVFDPANLFERAGSIAEQRRIVDGALDLLAPHIAVAHAKDRAPDGSFVSAGAGVLDYRHYFSRLKRAGFDGCVVAHGLRADEAGRVSAMLKGLLREA